MRTLKTNQFEGSPSSFCVQKKFKHPTLYLDSKPPVGRTCPSIKAAIYFSALLLVARPLLSDAKDSTKKLHFEFDNDDASLRDLSEFNLNLIIFHQLQLDA